MIEILRITGAYGIRGLLRALLFSDQIKFYDHIYDDCGNQMNVKIVRYIGGNRVLLSISDISDRDEAEKMKGKSLYAKAEDLPNLSDEEVYICNLIGKNVCVLGSTDNNEYLIANICNFGAGDLVEISQKAENSFFVPFKKEYFPGSLSAEMIEVTVEAINQYKL